LPAVPAEKVVVPHTAGPSYVQQVVELVRQTAEAAHALHEAGVVHRDIKPGNIIVRAEDGQAVLVDLGLAQLSDLVQGKLTRTRQFVGTLRYASPEQVLAVERVDRRSDVYSLGATLWELLTLRPIFNATDEMPTPEVMKRIQYSEPERIGTFHSGIPADLEAIVSRCLEKDASRRYASARELADDLARWQRGEPVEAHRLTWSYRLGKWARRQRRRIVWTTGLVLLQVLLVGGVVGMWLWMQRDSHTGGNEPTGQLPGESKVVPGNRRALLVGCSSYPKLSAQFQLKGPENDVQLMRKLLIDRFQFPDENIVRLTDQESKKPTRKEIEEEIKALAAKAGPGDQVVVFLSGNGHQVPVKQGPSRPRKDSAPAEGDEQWVNLFLPVDVDRFAETHAPPQAISGSEFAGWIEVMVNQGPSVWIICDFCCGDFGLRPEWTRSAPLAPPPEGGMAFLFAARNGEIAPEKRVRVDGDERYYGLLTYTLVEVLTQANQPIVYTELARRVQDRYLALGRTIPVPRVAGTHVGKTVLGYSSW
jgi:hypothetical protein